MLTSIRRNQERVMSFMTKSGRRSLYTSQLCQTSNSRQNLRTIAEHSVRYDVFKTRTPVQSISPSWPTKCKLSIHLEISGLLNHLVPIAFILEMEGQRQKAGKQLTRAFQIVVFGNESSLAHVFCSCVLNVKKLGPTDIGHFIFTPSSSGFRCLRPFRKRPL